MKTITRRLRHESTGIWIWLEEKQSFGKSYYSADAGLTWHANKSRAYRHAKSTGNLAKCANQS